MPSPEKIKEHYFTITIFFSLILIYIIAQHYLGSDILPFKFNTFQWDKGERVYPLYGQFSSMILMMTLPIMFFTKDLSALKKLFFIFLFLLIFTGFITGAMVSIMTMKLPKL